GRGLLAALWLDRAHAEPRLFSARTAAAHGYAHRQVAVRPPAIRWGGARPPSRNHLCPGAARRIAMARAGILAVPDARHPDGGPGRSRRSCLLLRPTEYRAFLGTALFPALYPRRPA